MHIKVAFEDLAEQRYQRIKSVTFWALVTVVLVFSIVFINSCTNPIPAHAEEVDMNIIAQIESNCNPSAFNKKSGAIGLLQITKPVLDDFNQRYSKKELYYEIKDLYELDVNWKIGSWYMNIKIPQMLRYYSIPDCVDYRLMAYNWGIGNLKKWHKKYAYTNNHFNFPKETQNYIKKYHKLEKEK